MALDHPISPLEAELYCFKTGRTPEQGGLGRFEHFKNAANMVWPNLEWNPWLETQIESLCEYDWVSWTGCAASGKTFGSALYALVWWLADPTNSTVILTSTTARMIRKRAWANIQTLWRTSAGRFPGNMVSSQMSLQAIKGDSRSAIFGVAVLDGATAKAVANIQGIHSPRVLSIVDEATDTPAAAFEACSNLSKGCKTFQFLAIGNPHSILDEHGRFSEPVAGWGSVGVDNERWETKRGVCVKFDGMKSPNVLAGKAKYEYLITSEQVKQAKEFDGESSPRFWKFTRGHWPPSGIVRTVLSEAMCTKYRVQGSHTFLSRSEVIAGLDPAFGGDRCVLRFAEYGDLSSGAMGVDFKDVVVIDIDSAASEPIHFQISRKVRALCEGRGCRPENLAVDATGEGGGLCDILSKEWSNKIHRVEFGGKASDLPVSAEDTRASSDAYANKVTELWFSVRQWVQRDQVRGLDSETLVELCGRMFDDERRKIVVERKVDMKARTGRSPDLADAAALVIDLARTKGGGNLNNVANNDKDWRALSLKYDSIYNEEATYGSTN